jgi:hypothetical protein
VLVVLRRFVLPMAVLALAACSGGGSAASSSPSTPATTASPAASASASVAPASAAPSGAASPSASVTPASASPSAAAAGCMPKATRDLLMDNLSKLGTLTQAQRDEIVAALKAYDFPDANGDRWRDDMVAAITNGDFSTAGLGAMSIVSGQVTLKACP